MNLAELLSDKSKKPKEKTEILSRWILEKNVTIQQLIEFAGKSKDPVKATCIESLEFASQTAPALVDEKAFQFVVASLAAKAPRIKWESAKVIGNTVHLYSTKLEGAIKGLLNNTEHEGTVVRWSAAFALGQILKLKTKYNNDLLPAIEAICEREEKNSIKKIYLEAIKKTKLK